MITTNPSMNVIQRPTSRPLILDYGAPQMFLQDLVKYYKVTRKFSLREQSRSIHGCSQALLSQILAGKRNLTRSNLLVLAKAFELTASETKYLDEKLVLETSSEPENSNKNTRSKVSLKTPKNHILTRWHHLYIKDLIHLKGFKATVPAIQRMLFGVVSIDQIKKSVEFLVKEGFWRKTASGEYIAEENLLVSTVDIPNDLIKNFHKKALNIALEGLDKFPVGMRRKTSTTLLSVTKKSSRELRDLMDRFHLDLQKFIEDHEDDGPGDELVQVTVHLTPIGVKNE